MKISRVMILTLGVADLGKATEFYKTVLGTPPNISADGITFIELPGTWIGLYSNRFQFLFSYHAALF